MIELKCECGGGVEVPASFVGEPAACPLCGRTLRVLSATPMGMTPACRLLVAGVPPQLELGTDTGLVAGDQLLLAGDLPLEVGSGGDKHLCLSGMQMSGNHCRLLPTPGGWEIEDAGVAGTLLVNGLPEQRRLLEHGDQFALGEYQFTYHAPSISGDDSTVWPATDDDQSPDLQLIPETPAAPLAGDEFANVGVSYDLKDESSPSSRGGRSFKRYSVLPSPLGPAMKCSSCGKTYDSGVRICVACGVDLRTGRPILVSQAVEEDAVVVHTETTIDIISWFIPFGLFPITSEAFGTKKPYVVWAIVAMTTLFSLVFLASELVPAFGPLPAGSNLMLWVGEDTAEAPQQLPGIPEAVLTQLGYPLRQLTLDFHWYQLFTHALLHGGFMHLAGNMLFLWVFGTRVNALLGNIKTAIIYPLLAMASGLAFMIANLHSQRQPMLGASGAIMGLAGMYIVFFPVHRVYMAIWLRAGWFNTWLGAKIFSLRGFWVVLFYIMFDIVATLLRFNDHVAHWAHLGGFIAGMATALILLLSRQVNALGGDLLSVILGRHAWFFLGRPRQQIIAGG